MWLQPENETPKHPVDTSCSQEEEVVVQLQPTQGRTGTASRPLRSCDSSDVIHIASDSTRFNFPSARTLTSLYKHKSPSVETIHTHTLWINNLYRPSISLPVNWTDSARSHGRSDSLTALSRRFSQLDSNRTKPGMLITLTAISSHLITPASSSSCPREHVRVYWT